MDEAIVVVEEHAPRLVVNVTDVLRKIIAHFDPRAGEIYLNAVYTSRGQAILNKWLKAGYIEKGTLHLLRALPGINIDSPNDHCIYRTRY